MESREARLDHLEVGAEAEPGRQREVVEELDALLVLDRQRLLDVVADAVVVVADAPAVAAAVANQAGAADAEVHRPAQAVRVAVGDAEVPEQSAALVGIGGGPVEVLVEAVGEVVAVVLACATVPGSGVGIRMSPRVERSVPSLVL